MRKRYFVVWDSKKQKWQLKEEKKNRAIKNFDTKSEAIKYSRTFTKNKVPSQLIIKKKDGKIEKEWTYGNDPYPPKG